MLSAVPRQEWEAFCQQFSRQHQGWLVTVSEQAGEASHPDGEARVRLEQRALREVRVLPAPADGAAGAVLEIVAGDEGQPAAEHRILAPTRLALEATSEGGHRGLRIESAEGITWVRFRVAAAPEQVNGFH